MRICIVTPYFPSFSVLGYNEGGFLLKEAKQLMKLGHKFVVVTCRHSGLPNYEMVNGIPVYRVSSILIPKIRYPVPNLLKLVSTILEVLKKYRIQLLDFWDQSYPTAIPAVFLKKMVKIPISVSVGGLMGLNWFYGEKIVDLVGLLHSLTLTKLILGQADGIRSEYLSLTETLSKLGIRKNVWTIYRGVDADRFRPDQSVREKKRRELKINRDGVVVLYVGRFEVVKGLKYLVEAAKHLVKEYPHLSFLFVGEGTLREKYENTMNISENLIFLGFRPDVAELMNVADVFVLPSLSEGCSAAILEASSCGLPVVASSVGGNCETVVDGVTGICVNPRKADELRKAIEQLVNDRRVAEEMGRNGRARVQQVFDPEKIATKVEEYYEHLASTKS